MSKVYSADMFTSLQFLVVFLILLQFFIEQTLSKLNDFKMIRLKSQVPSSLDGLMTDADWEKCTNYNIAKSRLSTLENIFSTVLVILVILFVYPLLFDLLPLSKDSSIWISAFYASCFLLLLQIPMWPFEWKRQFVLEEQFGFNTNTQKNWILDKAKESMLSLFLGSGLLALLLGLHHWGVQTFPTYWWLFAFLAFFSVQILLMVLWPKFILPLFNKLSPLDDEELGSRLLNLAQKTGFKASAIEVIDGSKRSRHSNAFFTGFGKFRRIIFYDTLLEQMNHDQVEAVLAHEIGHYKLGHVPKRIFLSFLTGLAFFGLLGFLCGNPWVYKELGVGGQYVGSLMPLILAFALMGSAFTFWFKPLGNYLSRKHEFEADRFAVRSVGNWNSLSSALRKLHVENLSYPTPHPWVSAFHYSHPTLLEREAGMKSPSTCS